MSGQIHVNLAHVRWATIQKIHLRLHLGSRGLWPNLNTLDVIIVAHGLNASLILGFKQSLTHRAARAAPPFLTRASRFDPILKDHSRVQLLPSLLGSTGRLSAHESSAHAEEAAQWGAARRGEGAGTEQLRRQPIPVVETDLTRMEWVTVGYGSNIFEIVREKQISHPTVNSFKTRWWTINATFLLEFLSNAEGTIGSSYDNPFTRSRSNMSSPGNTFQ